MHQFQTSPLEALTRENHQLFESAKSLVHEGSSKAPHAVALAALLEAAQNRAFDQVVITAVTPGSDQERGSLTLCNLSPLILNMEGWRILAGSSGQECVFNKETLLRPGQSIVISASGTEPSFNSKMSVWDNRGDEATLYDRTGHPRNRFIYGVAAEPEVAITEVFYDGAMGRGEADEYVSIANLSKAMIGLGGWELRSDRGSQRFVFPEGATVAPESQIRVYTNLIDPLTGGFSFDSPRAIWNNQGDTAVLLGSTGREVDRYSYLAEVSAS